MGSTKYPEHLGFIKIGGLILALSITRVVVWSGVIDSPPGDRRAANLGFACSCAASSEPCWRGLTAGAAVDDAGSGRFLFVIGTESGSPTVISVASEEGVVSEGWDPPVLGVVMVTGVESADSSSSLSNADIDRLLGPSERPASSRDLRSVPKELDRRL